MTIGVGRAEQGRVLVTGASGFVGRWAVSALGDLGFEVHGVAREDGLADIAWHRADLLDEDERGALIAAVRPDFLLHLAWYTDHGHFWTTPENDAWREASLDLLARFVRAGGRHAVFAGSCAEYDWSSPAPVPWREDRPCHPATLYGRAKLELAMRGQVLADAAGVSFVWGRLFTPVGLHEGAERLVPSLIRALLEGRVATTGPGDLVRDFLDVRDVGRAFALLVDRDISGPINIASGDGISIQEIAVRIAGLIGRPELLGVGHRPPRSGDAHYMVADVTLLRQQVGFERQFTLDQTLRDAIDYWKAILDPV